MANCKLSDEEDNGNKQGTQKIVYILRNDPYKIIDKTDCQKKIVCKKTGNVMRNLDEMIQVA